MLAHSSVPERWSRLAFRLLALVALGVIAVLFYQRIREIAGVYPSQPSLYFWPQLGVSAVAVASCALVLATRPVPSRLGQALELAVILALGIAFRMVYLTALPALSHDAFRYVWDAHLVAHGVSPYIHPLDDPALAALRDGAIWPRVNWRNAPTIYPPGAQAFFLLVHAIAPLSIQAMKLAMGICDVLCGLLTLVLLRQRGLDPRRVVVYWWNPIPVIEFWYSGHVDALATLEVLAAVLFATRSWRGARVLAGILLGLAALTKIYPLLFALALLRGPAATGENERSAPASVRAFRALLRTARLFLWRNRAILTGLIATLLLVPLPFVRLGLGDGGFLGTYFSQRFIDQGVLLRFITLVIVSKPAQVIVQALVLACLSLIAFRLRLRGRWSLEACILLFCAAWIVVSPHMFPWYVGGVLPFLALSLCPPSLRALAMADKHTCIRRAASAETEAIDLAHAWRGGWASEEGPLVQALFAALWLFVLAMPFTYVIFAQGGNGDLFPWFFVVPALAAVGPLTARFITQQVRSVSSASGIGLSRPLRQPLRAATTMTSSPKE